MMRPTKKTTSQVFLSAAALGGVSRGISILVRLFSVPLAIALLSSERYGLWLIICSLVGWLGISDLGIPAALQNRLTAAVQANDAAAARAAFAFAARLLIGISLLILIAGIALALAIPWHRLFKIEEGFRVEFGWTLALCVLGFAIELPSRLGGAVYSAHGRLAIPPLADIYSQLAAFGMLGVAVLLHWRSLLVLVCGSLLGLVLGPLYLTVRASLRYGYGLGTGEISAVDRHAIASKGIFFFVTSLGQLLILQSDALVLGALSGPKVIPAIMVPLALWMNFLQLQNIFLRPLWPIMSARYNAQRRDDLRRLFSKALAYSLYGALAFAAGVLLCGDWFIRLWSRGTVALPPVMALGLGLYVVAAAIDNLLATFLNACNKIEIRFLYTLAFGVTKVGVAVVIIKFSSLEWLPLGFAAVMLVTSIPFAAWGVARSFGELPESPHPDLLDCPEAPAPGKV